MKLPFKIELPEDGKISREDLKDIEKKNENLVSVRGQVISLALLVEQKVDRVLSNIFSDSKEKGDLFKSYILEKESFTFMNKWRLLRDLSKEGILDFGEERKNFLENLKKLIFIRDRFAHGDIVFSGKTPRLGYLKAGKHVSVDLDEKYFNELNEVFRICFRGLKKR